MYSLFGSLGLDEFNLKIYRILINFKIIFNNILI